MNEKGVSQLSNTVLVRFGTLCLDVREEMEVEYAWDIPRIMQETGFANQAQEVFWAVAYDSSQQVRTIVEIARGGYHEVDIPIPAILAAVLKSGVDRFSVVHNHPSADVRPTAPDVTLTGSIRLAAEFVRLSFEDHVIVGPTKKSYSFRDAGKLTIPGYVQLMAKTNKAASR